MSTTKTTKGYEIHATTDGGDPVILLETNKRRAKRRAVAWIERGMLGNAKASVKEITRGVGLDGGPIRSEFPVANYRLNADGKVRSFS